jgi:hypothetical protein
VVLRRLPVSPGQMSCPSTRADLVGPAYRSGLAGLSGAAGLSGLVCLLGMVGLLGLAGCGGAGGRGLDGPRVELRYENQPLAGALVRLHLDPKSDPVLSGVTDDSGVAILDGKAGPGDGSFAVSLEAVSGGGWIFVPRVTEAATSDLKVTLQAGSAARIELPAGSIRPLGGRFK